MNNFDHAFIFPKLKTTSVKEKNFKISKFLVQATFERGQRFNPKYFTFSPHAGGRTSVLEGDINFADTAINGSLSVDRVDG